MDRIATLLVALLLAGSSLFASEPPRDRIEILAITPEGPVPRGVETTFMIDVEADLQSGFEGVVMLGFNSESPARFMMIDTRELAAGQQQFTFEVSVIPVDWQEKGEFSVLVNMGQPSDGNSWKPTASDRQVIGTTP